MAAIGSALGNRVRSSVDPRVYCYLSTSNLAYDPYARRIAFPLEVDSLSHLRGGLRVFGRSIALGQRLDVLVYDFAQGGPPRVVYSTPLDRSTGSGLTGWGKDGLHISYGDHNGYRHVVIDPDRGTVAMVPQSMSQTIADSLITIQYALEETPGYRDVKWRGLQCYERNPRTGLNTILFEYKKEYAGIPLESRHREDSSKRGHSP